MNLKRHIYFSVNRSYCIYVYLFLFNFIILKLLLFMFVIMLIVFIVIFTNVKKNKPYFLNRIYT